MPRQLIGIKPEIECILSEPCERLCQRHRWTESMDGDPRWAAWAFRAWWFDPAVATVGFAVPIYTYWALEIRHAKAGRPAQCRCFLLS